MAAPVPDRRPAKRAAAATPPPPAPEPTPEPKRRGALLPAGVLAVALLGAAFLLRGGGGSPAAPAVQANTPAAAAAATDPAHVVSLPPITLNLADGRFLKLGMALQLSDATAVPPDGAAFGARALDEAITVFGNHTVEDLTVPGARDKVKKELGERVSALYDHHVVALYLTQFVMQ